MSRSSPAVHRTRKSRAPSRNPARRLRRGQRRSTSCSDRRRTSMWEALAAIGSILSAVVIAATVIFAARQVRVTVDQLEQVRRSTQFEAARTVLHELAEPEFVDAYLFIYHDLDRLMKTPDFRRDIALIG